jgi:hypothetical protein
MAFIPSSLLFQNFSLISGILFGISDKQMDFQAYDRKKAAFSTDLYYGKVIACSAPEV